MIAFDLGCGEGHRFEGWFDDGAAFEHQLAEGMIACPICGSEEIARLPSAFAIKGGGNGPDADDYRRVAEVGRKLAEIVENKFDNVGSDFATEALKIHYGASEPRNIRGVSTPQEEKTLKDEGIQFFKLPVPSTKEDA
jgi:hypothetical protein